MFRSLIPALVTIVIVVFSNVQTGSGRIAYAAPSPIGGAMGGGGGGGNCPPGCPVTPANCDANLIITPTPGISLQFGSMAGSSGGTVTIDPVTNQRSSIGVILLTGGSEQAASFDMSTAPYNCNGTALPIITAGPTATLSNITTPGMTMTVDTFVTNPAAGGTFSDTTPLTVGATLHVNANQDPGSYSGTYDLTVNFQ